MKTADEMRNLMFDMKVCKEGFEWLVGKDSVEFWSTCHRGDWMAYWTARCAPAPHGEARRRLCRVLARCLAPMRQMASQGGGEALALIDDAMRVLRFEQPALTIPVSQFFDDELEAFAWGAVASALHVIDMTPDVAAEAASVALQAAASPVFDSGSLPDLSAFADIFREEYPLMPEPETESVHG